MTSAGTDEKMKWTAGNKTKCLQYGLVKKNRRGAGAVA